jgi:hypothetical protein
MESGSNANTEIPDCKSAVRNDGRGRGVLYGNTEFDSTIAVN